MAKLNYTVEFINNIEYLIMINDTSESENEIQESTTDETVELEDGEIIEDESGYNYTTERWEIYLITDRRLRFGVYEYKVLWKNKNRDITWEPRNMLVNDGYTDELSIVDRWKTTSSNETFLQYLQRNSNEVVALIGDNERNDCVAVALNWCFRELGINCDISLQFNHFIGQNVFNGFKAKYINSFMKKLIINHHLNINLLAFMNNIVNRRLYGFTSLLQLGLPDGIYLVIAYHYNRKTGHAFGIKVHDGRLLVFDEEVYSSYYSYDGVWIGNIACIKRICLNK